jgi:hypothetical protein
MKQCVRCKKHFSKRSREGHKDFAARRFCGNECLRASLRRGNVPTCEPRGTYYTGTELHKRVANGRGTIDSAGIMHLLAEGRRAK